MKKVLLKCGGYLRKRAAFTLVELLVAHVQNYGDTIFVVSSLFTWTYVGWSVFVRCPHRYVRRAGSSAVERRRIQIICPIPLADGE